MTDEWTIEFYAEENGYAPVLDFLEGLDKKTKARFQWYIEQIRVLNVQAREPLVKHGEGKIWEIREESNTNIYRILYFFYTGKRIVLLHGFAKKTSKLPRRELDIALKRLADYVKRKGSK